MLRRRTDRPVINNESEEKFSNILSDYSNKNQKDNVHNISSLSAVLLIIAGVLLFDIIVKIHNSTPHALKIADEKNYPDNFIAERAQNHLKQLANIGPKVAGSYENEVLAVDFLKREINFIIQQANRAQKLELDHQIVSGSYFLGFKPHGLVNIYENVQNIVVRVASKDNSSHSLLINCHFDTVPTSPGASDDGIMCVSMIEVLRVLSRENIRPSHNIIFLFNGAEETPLQAAHGFITKHRWAKEVKSVINLEAAGSGGREILFQAGPGNKFLLDAYLQKAPHPFGHSAGEEIFQNNLIPSDTDFRVFRDFGHIPGLDFAFARNGYVYHTKHDSFEKIEAGSYQHVGDNLLAIVKHLANSPDLPNATLKSKDLAVYFDFLGWFIISYSDQTAFIVNIVTILASIFMFFKMLYDVRQSSWIEIIVNIFLSGAVQVAGIVLSLFFIVVFAFFLDQFNLTMTWYTRPRIIFGLFMCPCFIIFSMFLILLNNIVENISISLGTRTQIHATTNRMFWTFLLFITSFFVIRTSYIFLIPVLFNTITFVIISILNLQHTRRTWLYVYMLSLVIPTVFAMYITTIILELFIPITGRFGSNRNPDDYIGLLSAVGCLLIVSGYVPLLTLIKKPGTVIAGLLMTFLITIGCIVFTNYGFPYSGDVTSPSPQRYWIYHTNRVFHDERGNVRKQDSGFFMLNMDRNSPRSIEKFVPEIQNAVPVTKDCEEVLFCGLPVYTSRMLSLVEESTWIPAPPPVLHEQVNLKLVSKVNITTYSKRYTFKATGPDRFAIFLSPKLKTSIKKWSFIQDVPETTLMWQNRPTYFIAYAYGDRPKNGYEFWIDIDMPEHWNGPVMDIAISGKYTHHDKTRTDHFKEFLNQFPGWTDLTAWMANYHSWIY